MIRKFPVWAPPSLVEWYQERTAELDDPNSWKGPSVDVLHSVGLLHSSKKLAILKVMLTHQEMEKVWGCLRRRARFFKRTTGRFPLTQEWSLVQACEIGHERWMRTLKHTPAKARALYADIANKMSEVNRLICSIYHSDGAIGEIQDFMDDGAFCALANAFGLEEEEFPHSRAADYVRFWLGDALPPMPLLLDKIARRARELAEDPPGVVAQPNTAQAPMIFFVRHMSAYFKDKYGQPLNAQVARLATALFDAQVDEDNVRKLIQKTNPV